MRLLRYLAGGSLLLLLICATAIYLALRASLPQIEGELHSASVENTATIERDSFGVPTIRASSRNDLAFATGVAHAQDRFFQMDLMRRAAAGELAALLGPSLVEADRKLRLHQFRAVASEVVRDSTPREREVLASYVAGVNLGLESLGARPWEYWVLRSEPAPWRIEDSVLVAFSMYLNLNDSTGTNEIARGRLRNSLPPELYAFLHPVGTEWDAPIVGGPWRTPPIPGPETVDLRNSGAPSESGTKNTRNAQSRASDSSPQPPASSFFWSRSATKGMLPGSNSWAVAGTHTANGAALLANDMHLGLRLPNVWYQARLIVKAAGRNRRDLAGVTLPGLPMLIVGSNGKVAWGYTNSYGDWTDVVIVESDPQNPSRYATPDGYETFEMHRERIAVNGAPDAELEFRSTRWGPVIGADEQARPLALAWTAHHPEATNLGLLDLETAESIEHALDLANRAGVPVQNFVAVDVDGRIGWSLMGKVPVRGGYDATVPTSWRAKGTGWLGWREPEEYPRVIDPPSARLWTANARTIDAQTWFAFVGDGGYDIGARAAQIRDGLLSLSAATPQDMAALQLDDRALFLTRWRDLLLDTLDQPDVLADDRRRTARELVEGWSGRALVEDAGYRIVREFRNQVRNDTFASLTAAAQARSPDTPFSPSSQFEGPLWLLVTERPTHLLDPQHESWSAALLSSLDAALERLLQNCPDLNSCTWGRENTLMMRHSLSSALPFASRWLDMPQTPMNGDAAMPRVQSSSFGASERLVVSPGREPEGLFQMPGGPVDHPLSPYYGAGHEQWVKGETRSLLPGKAEHVLTLLPHS